MKRNGLIGAALAVSGTFGISWLGAIVYWRSGLHTPGPVEVAGLLLGMPTAMLASAAWWRRRGNRGMDTGHGNEAAADTGASTPSRDLDSPQRALAAVPAVSVNLPCGEQAGEIIGNRGALPALDLHPTLRDPSGMPVFAATIQDLDPAAFAAPPGPETSPAPSRPEWRRALSAAAPVVEELLDGSPMVPAGLLALVPADWTPSERELAATHLARLLAAAGDAGEPWIRVECAGTGAQALAMMSDVAPPRDSPTVVLCVAMASHIGERTVARWASGRRLLGSAHPQGHAPGEGAAGVALSAAAAAPGAPRWLLSRRQARTNPRDRGAELTALLGSSLTEAAIEPDAIGLLVTDADHRTDGLVEIGSAVAGALPGFDAPDGTLHLGQSCGDAGAVLAIASLALAASASGAMAAPALALSLDPDGRGLALLAPPAPPPPDAA